MRWRLLPSLCLAVLFSNGALAVEKPKLPPIPPIPVDLKKTLPPLEVPKEQPAKGAVSRSAPKPAPSSSAPAALAAKKPAVVQLSKSSGGCVIKVPPRVLELPANGEALTVRIQGDLACVQATSVDVSWATVSLHRAFKRVEIEAEPNTEEAQREGTIYLVTPTTGIELRVIQAAAVKLEPPATPLNASTSVSPAVERSTASAPVVEPSTPTTEPRAAEVQAPATVAATPVEAAINGESLHEPEPVVVEDRQESHKLAESAADTTTVPEQAASIKEPSSVPPTEPAAVEEQPVMEPKDKEAAVLQANPVQTPVGPVIEKPELTATTVEAPVQEQHTESKPIEQSRPVEQEPQAVEPVVEAAAQATMELPPTPASPRKSPGDDYEELVD